MSLGYLLPIAGSWQPIHIQLDWGKQYSPAFPAGTSALLYSVAVIDQISFRTKRDVVLLV
jgi:hypothetical protein